jgi:hypothetical protein
LSTKLLNSKNLKSKRIFNCDQNKRTNLGAFILLVITADAHQNEYWVFFFSVGDEYEILLRRKEQQTENNSHN